MAEKKIERPADLVNQRPQQPPVSFRDVVREVPRATKDVAQDIARGVTILPGLVASGYMSLAESARQGKPTFVQPTFDPSQSRISRAAFGEEKFTPYGEVVKFQDVFRSDTKQGQFRAGTPIVGAGLALADLPTGGGASATFRLLSKTLRRARNTARDIKTADEAIALLQKSGISKNTINTFDLANKVARATDEASIDNVFREAATAESTLRSTGKLPQSKQVNRTAPVARTQMSDIQPRQRPTADVELQQPTRPTDRTTTTDVRQKLRQESVTKLDKSQYIDREVMPQNRIPKNASLDNLSKKGLDTLGEVLNTDVKSLDLIPTSIQNNFRTIAGTAGVNTDKAFKDVVADFRKILDNRTDIARRIPDEPSEGFFQRQVMRFNEARNQPGGLQAGFARLPGQSEPRRNVKQTQAAPSVRRQNIENASIDELYDTTGPTTTSSVDNVIEQAKNKYDAIENIGLGDSQMARLAQRAPSLGASQLASDLLTPISSRLGRINPKLKFRLRNLEIETRRLTTERLEAVLPLMQATKRMSASDKAVFDLALKNGDSAVIDAFSQKYGITKELESARKMLDDVFKEAQSVGLEVNYRGDFFPRQVKNPEAFSQYLRGRDDWGSLRKQIEEKAEQQGKKFSDLTNEEIAGITNNLLRGYGSQITLAGPGQLKARKIEELGTELNKFYEDSNTALLTYVHKMTDEIEGRKFFGKAAGQKPKTKNPLTGEEAVFNTDDSIGAYVTKLIADGDISPQQQDEVIKILQARFKKGGMMGVLSAYRDLEYISTMGNPISAITQIGDLAFALYKNGWWNTARGIGATATRRTKLTKENLGIERIAQEFDNPAKTSKALERVFKLVGMEQIDRLGKETFLESSRLKLKTLANKGDEELLTDLNYMFDDLDSIKALEELKAGDVTVRTKEVIMNRLLDIQPIAKSEMPVKYLEMPNGRIFYMLKSFTIKQFDIFRREAIDKIVSGTAKQRAEGIRNLVYLSSVFMLANATADEIKDFILGRETEPRDRLVDNFYRLFGASKYDIYNSRERGLGFAVLQRLLPPASVFDRVSTDISRLSEQKVYTTGPLEGERYGSEAVQSIPGGGKLYYWWFGRGEQKQQYSNRGESTVETNESGQRVKTINRPGQTESSGSQRIKTIERI